LLACGDEAVFQLPFDAQLTVLSEALCGSIALLIQCCLEVVDW